MPRKKEKVILYLVITCLMLLTGCSPAPMVIEEIPVIESSPPRIVRPYVPYRNVLIVLDAGHGGEDFGAHSDTTPQYHEKNLNLTMAKMVRSFLGQQGFSTEMTRQDDTFVTLDNRAKYANVHNAALFVSLHFNSAPSKEAEGIEVYYYKSVQNQQRTDNSRKLASVILARTIEMTKAKSRGAKHGDFAVIRQTTMPAVLVEGGFLTNDNEMNKIKDPVYLKQLAWGIVLGIKDYLTKEMRL